MKIYALGVDYRTGQLLVPPLDEEAFGRQIEEALGANADDLRRRTESTEKGADFRREVKLGPVVDLRVPLEAGWTFLVDADNRDREGIIDVLRPLADLRGMADPSRPLEYRQDDDPFQWMVEHYTSLDTSSVPNYVMIVGSPDRIPFAFQALLGTAGYVGRVDLPIDGLVAYVDKLVRLQTAPEPIPERKVMFFAPDQGRGQNGSVDPTYFSRRYMVEPLADYVRRTFGYETSLAEGGEATKIRLTAALQGARPVVAYTASHGIGAPADDLEVQKEINGAICCQRTPDVRATNDWLFTAADIPVDEPFVEGGVFFEFACFGYGTPAQSDFMHWLGRDDLNAKEDFVAALPKRLLAHPRGPIAFIGHVDAAWLHGFDDPEHPGASGPWNRRMAPFVQALNSLLATEPVGLAMSDMNQRYSIANATLTRMYDQIQAKRIQLDAALWGKLATTFITRSDAQNYMVFGDPGAAVRMV